MNLSVIRMTLLTGFAILLMVQPTLAGDMGLIKSLTSQLGVTTDQAQGGAGAIFNLAKQNLSAADFNRIANVIPEMDTLIDAAPEVKGAASPLGKATSLLGSKSGKAGGIASLAESFSKLGLNADMVSKFTPIILDFTKSKGGESVMNLLKAVLL
jgi:hypothetical protein